LAAHEIKAPLTRLKACIELLQSDVLDGRLNPDFLEHTLDRMSRAIDSVTGVVKSFTDPTMLASHRLRAHQQPLEVGRLVAEVAASFPEVDLVQVDTSGMVVAGVPERLEQLLVNLFENARKYSRSGDRVRVTLQQSGAGLLLQVEDEGIGLPPGTAESIFGLFERASNAIQIQGQGMGLYICRQIVRQHGGKIWARSDGQDRGATFYVWLPHS
jgi:signal transduction histidine kinase